jgi:hypothetical protein
LSARFDDEAVVGIDKGLKLVKAAISPRDVHEGGGRILVNLVEDFSSKAGVA